jgi:excisionase family DNA binding protein
MEKFQNMIYKPEQIAQILQISLSQVYTLCREGILPSFKLGRNTRISGEELEHWLKSQSSENKQGFIL